MALFTVTERSKHVYLVLKVYKVLEGNLAKTLEAYGNASDKAEAARTALANNVRR